VLFERRLQAGLSDGSISLAFRRWRRPQVVAGRQYRSPIGMIDVESVSIVDERTLTPDDAHAAGYASVSELRGDLKGPPEASVYRLALRRSDAADPRSVLAEDAGLDADQHAHLERRLARLDAAAGRAWTRATLEAIRAAPGTRAGDLFATLGWSDLAEFKQHVRKLKALGLTLSLRIGYSLSPRGETYLRTLRGQPT
jgi:hypothetical protein